MRVLVRVSSTQGAIRPTCAVDSAARALYKCAIPGEPVARTQVESGIARDPSNLIRVIPAEGGKRLSSRNPWPRSD